MYKKVHENSDLPGVSLRHLHYAKASGDRSIQATLFELCLTQSRDK